LNFNDHRLHGLNRLFINHELNELNELIFKQRIKTNYTNFYTTADYADDTDYYHATAKSEKSK